MDKHPIESLMTTTMENIRDMIDVNTIIGEPISTQDGSTVIPISRVSFGFVAGGGEYAVHRPAVRGEIRPDKEDLPFAGGAGAGVTVQPLGFLVTNPEQVRLLPAQSYAPVDRIIELIPQAMCELKNVLMNCTCKERPHITAQVCTCSDPAGEIPPSNP
ncbi:MAG: sporulation protein YtfJ [Clostridiales bacterium]|nr:sporulation protein YtfJ [Clostridiales bacterium]